MNAHASAPSHAAPQTALPSALLASLREIVGADHVLIDGDLSAYEIDWRKRYRGRAAAVLRPGSTDEVAAIVRCCGAAGVAIVPQGGNTGLVGGGVPDNSGTQVLLSLRRLQRVRAIDPINLTLTVEAGCVLQTAQEVAEKAGLLLAVSLAAEGSCTIGGNLATNAGGTQVLRYGNAREQCLGLEVVTAEGQIWHGLSGLRKDNTGYDLRDLYVGSEGTLGIITAAVLKLHPLPVARMTALACCDDLGACAALLGLAHSRAAASLTGFEVMNDFALSLVRKHYPQLPRPLAPSPWTVLLEVSDSESESHARTLFEGLLADALERDIISDAAVAESISQSRAMWHLRESIPLAQSEEGLNIKHDIALPVSSIPAFVAETDALLQAAVPGVRLVNFGHLGDGNLHYNVQCPEGRDGAGFLAQYEAQVNTLVYQQVQRYEGSISAEHGIGALKRDELAHYKSPVALDLMRRVKAALDPHGVMNPSRLLPAADPTAPASDGP